MSHVSTTTLLVVSGAVLRINVVIVFFGVKLKKKD